MLESVWFCESPYSVALGNVMAACKSLIFIVFVLFIGFQAPQARSMDWSRVISIVSKAHRIDELASVGQIFRNVHRLENGVEITEAARYILRTGFADEVKRGVYLGFEGEELVLISRSESARWGNPDYLKAAADVSLRASGERSEIFKLFVEEDVFIDERFPAFVSSLPQNVSIAYVSSMGRLSSIRLANINGSVEPLFAWGPEETLFVHAHNDDTLRLFAEVNLREFKVNDVRLVALFDRDADYFSVQELKNAVEGRGVKSVFSARPDLNDLFKSANDSLVLVVGHTEDGKFVVRGSDNAVIFDVSFSELREMQEKYNTSVMLLGCETGLGGSLTTLHSLSVAQQLKQALAAPTYGEFFAALGTPESPFVVTSQQINQSSILLVRRIEAQRRLEATVSLRTAQVLRLPGPSLAERAMGLIVAMVQYILRLVLLIFLLFVVVGLATPLINFVCKLFRR